MTTTPPLPPPGWYPVPDDATAEQWWTGRNWGTDRRQAPSASAPVAAPMVTSGRRGVRFGAIVAVLLAALVVVFVVQVLTHLNPSAGADGTTTGRVAQSDTHQVTYLVTGSAPRASVTLQTATGTQQHDVQIPMETADGSDFTFSANVGQFIYISAQNSGADGDVTCTITVDGEKVSENTSTGAYGIAQCDASVE